MINKREQKRPYLYHTKQILSQKLSQETNKTLYNDKRDNSLGRYNNLTIYAPNTGAAKYMQQILRELKGEIATR